MGASASSRSPRYCCCRRQASDAKRANGTDNAAYSETLPPASAASATIAHSAQSNENSASASQASSQLKPPDRERKRSGWRFDWRDEEDIYRVFVQTSWRVESSVLTLLSSSTDLTKTVMEQGRRNEWVQLSGHSGAFSVASPWTILKLRERSESHELSAYKQLMLDDSCMRDFVPKFYREVEYDGQCYLELEDLMQHFTSPCIMDVKMGCRTFLETDADNPELRPDLYNKMIAVDPSQPTEAETRLGAITKLRLGTRKHAPSTAAA